MLLRSLVAGTAILVLSLPTLAQNTPPSVEAQSQAFVKRYIDTYGAYTEIYLQLFVAQTKCNYDFVEEETFNDLADDMLRRLIADLKPAIRQHQAAAGLPPSDAWTKYTASMTVLSMVDALATIRSAEIQKRIDATPDFCETARSENQERFEKLKALMAKQPAPR